MAAEAAARTWNCKRFSLPITDALHGHGFEILLFNDKAKEIKDDDENDDYEDIPY